MDKINDIKLVLDLLKDGELLTINHLDYFYYKKDKIHHYIKGTHYSLSEEDFINLYKDNIFYLYENTFEIDETKDEDYYRYYKK